MKFKEITLVNFMRYKGENTIRFSTDDKMNVTAILGNNTVGKTTIAQAFRRIKVRSMIKSMITGQDTSSP